MAIRDIVLESAKKHLRFIKPSGSNIGGPCPFHKEGKESRPSFYISLDNGCYFCHACGEKGTFPQFLKRMGEHASKVDRLLELFKTEEKRKPITVSNLHGKHYLKESLLGVFDYCPVKLVKDGFDEKLLRKLDVGFDKEERRITFPIRDMYGHLVGLSGRTVIDAYPRYKVYKSKDLLRFASDDYTERSKYENYDIKNHDYLWNMHNVFPDMFFGDLDTLIIVEGYKACLWMIQNGFDNTVALQGSRMSRQQEETIGKFSTKVYIFLDNNRAGKEGTKDTGKRLIHKRTPVYIVTYPDYVDEGAQPDNLTKEEILASLDAAPTYSQWRSTCPTHHKEVCHSDSEYDSM